MGQQKPREKPNKPKKPKKTILNGLTQDSSHRIGFFGFSSSFWTIGLGRVKKPREKPKKIQKKKKTILHGLTQDSSHRIVFFGFPEFLDIWKAENGKKRKKTKRAKTQRSQRGFLFFSYLEDPGMIWYVFLKQHIV